MRPNRSRAFTTLLLLAFAASPGADSARAGLVDDIGRGLGFFGFQSQGAHNPLSGGANFLINQNFVGNPLDFGAWDLRLAGPISLQTATGNRGLATFDLSLRTAVNRTGAASPLTYALTADVGGQSTQITGSLFLDANFSINGFGFYDLDLAYSSRQNVLTEGRFENSNQQFDADLGPVNISGNIFADVLAWLTDPFFESNDLVNPFDSFSGRAKLNDLLAGAGSDALHDLAGAGAKSNQSLLDPATTKTLTTLAGVGGDDYGGLAKMIPEPTVIILTLIGAPLAFAGRLRRRASTQ